MVTLKSNTVFPLLSLRLEYVFNGLLLWGRVFLLQLILSRNALQALQEVCFLVDLRYNQLDYFPILFSIPMINTDRNQPGQERVYWAYRFQSLKDGIQSRNWHRDHRGMLLIVVLSLYCLYPFLIQLWTNHLGMVRPKWSRLSYINHQSQKCLLRQAHSSYW